MAQPWETPYPVAAAAQEHPAQPWETPFPGSSDYDPPAGAKRIMKDAVETAPGMKEAQTPLDALQAGWQMSASGLLKRGGAPADFSIPSNASFGTKLMSGIGGFVGDLPWGIVGAVGGAAAGGAATAETGPGAAVGATVGGGAGGFALPEAIRQASMDAYKLNKDGAHMTAGDILHMAAHSAWETGKAGAIGAVAGATGKVAEVTSPIWKSAASMAAFTTSAVGMQAAANGRMPDQADLALTAVSALGFGTAAHYVGSAAGPKVELKPAGEQVAHNLSEAYRQAGIMPLEATQRAAADPAKNDELYTADVNGDPNLSHFNADRDEEAEPYKTNAFKIQEEHEQDVRAAETQGFENAGQRIRDLLPKVRALEGSADDAISPKGAVGRYQVMPGTARQYGFDPAQLTDPKYNEMVARSVLSDLSRRFKGDEEAILVAYNAGPGRAFKFIRDGRDTSELPTETQHYLIKAGYGGKGGEPPEPPPEGPPPPEEGREPSPEFLRAQADADFESQLGEQPKAKQTGTGLVRQFVSELESARGIDRTLIKQGLIDPQKDLSTEDMFRQTYASDDRTYHMIMRGNVDPITFDEKPGTSLLGDDGVLTNLKAQGGNLHDFNLYRIAQRTVDLKERGNVLGVFQGDKWLEKAQAVLDKPEFKQYEKINAQMQMWKRGFLEYGRDSGVLSQKQIAAMEAASSHVSIRRVMGDDGAFKVGGGAGKGFRVQNPIQRMEGSERQIIDPVAADVDNARMIVRMADRNRAIGNILSIPSLVKALALRKVDVPGAAIAEAGSSVFKPYSMMPEQEAAFEHFAHLKAYGEKGSNQFTFFRDGKREVWEADDPAIAELMRGIDNKPSQITVGIMGHQLDLMKALAFPAKLERAGIIGALDFPLRVFQKHALTAWTLDPLSPPPIITGVRGLAQAISKGEDYYKLMRKGGLSRSVSGDDVVDQINKAINDQDTLTKTGALERGWNVLATPLHFMQAVNETLATAERIGYMKRAAKLGVPDIKAATRSRAAFLDFQERAVNSMARWFAQNVPFFKSTMLGLKMTRDGIVADPWGSAAKGIVGLVGAQVGLYALNRMADQFIDDPTKRYTSLPQWQRDQYFITPPLGPNGTRLKLGRPYVIGPMLAVPVERELESMFEKDPHAFDGWLGAMLSDTTPGFLPASVRPIMEEMTNHNFFTGQPLVSDNLKERTADEQYTDNTSKAAIDASRILSSHRGLGIADVSPIVIDNFVNEWTGTWGMGLLKALDAPLGKTHDLRNWNDSLFIKGFVTQNPRFNTQQMEDFYKDGDAWNKLHADAVEEIKRGDPQGIADKTTVGRTTVLVQKFDHALNVIRQATYAVEENKDMSKDEKRQLANQLYMDAWHTARVGSALLRGGAADNNELEGLNQQITSDVTNATQ